METKELIRRLQTIYDESTLGDIPIIVEELQKEIEIYRHIE